MKKLLQAFILALFIAPFLAGADFSNIAISEILFDPAGTDTGLEYIIIKNFSNDAVSLSGLDLYPDGIGYFTFPQFSIAGGKSVKVHLRQTDTDDDANLYFSGATGNMGNSSGAIALFSGTAHGKDTIISYVRYHKTGSSERKTWESSAASAGIWTAGEVINISSFAEGAIIELFDYSKRFGPEGWRLKTEDANGDDESDSSADEAAENNSDSSSSNNRLQESAYGPLPLPEKIRAYAGKDQTVLAGGAVLFDGYAEDLDGNPLDGARYLWNFGDGATSEGKNVSHAYALPGTYTVYLNVSAGIYSSTDVALVTVTENPLIVSEIKFGDDGWIEVYNSSSRTIDVSLFGIWIVGTEKPFYFPRNTLIAPHAYLALSQEQIGFLAPASGEIRILYSSGKTLFASVYPLLPLEKNESLNFSEGVWQKGIATPGAKNKLVSGAADSARNIKNEQKTVTKKQISVTENKIEGKTSQTANIDGVVKNTTYDALLHVNQQTASVFNSTLALTRSSSFLWLVGGIGGGIFAGALLLIMRRKFF